MKLKINISKKSEQDSSDQLEFNRFPVVIGREDVNEVILPDPFKIVSRKHAKIINTEGILQLIDLESANFTFLNGQKINPNEEYALKSGDKINIGEYDLDVELLQEQDADDYDDEQKTMVFSNPFADEVSELTDTLKKLFAKYAFDESPMKGEMLKISLMQSLNDLEKNDVSKLIAEYFAENYLDKSFTASSKKSEEIKPKPKIQEKPVQQKEEKIKESIQSLPTDYSFNSLFSSTIDLMLETFTKLIQGFLQFRQEFFGVTIYHTIPTGSLKEMKEFLFNPEITQEEEKKRLDLLKEETQKLLTHQIGLLEGYRISVTEGSQSLLHSLDPDTIEKEMEMKNQQSSGLDFDKILPFTKKIKVLDAIKENYSKYASDPYHIEKKFFRPSFMKGYQKRILSKNKENEY